MSQKFRKYDSYPIEQIFHSSESIDTKFGLDVKDAQMQKVTHRFWIWLNKRNVINFESQLSGKRAVFLLNISYKLISQVEISFPIDSNFIPSQHSMHPSMLYIQTKSYSDWFRTMGDNWLQLL